jgi:Neuraminidase (sialidase)
MKIKVRYTYTVVREGDISSSELEDDIDFFKGAMSDETGEFLYSGTGMEERISVKMEISKDGGKTWEEVQNEIKD